MKPFEHFVDVALLVASWVIGLTVVIGSVIAASDAEQMKYPLPFLLLVVVSVICLLAAYTIHWKKRFNKK